LKIAVTGATGFVGSHLIDRLVADGHEPIALARRSSDIRVLSSKNIQVVMGDVTDPEAVKRVVSECSVVINLARAKAHGQRPQHEVTSVNVDGARNVAREAGRVGADLIHASSTAVYGSRIVDIPVNETSPLNPDSMYANSKLDGESAVTAENDTAIILRISAVLGPRCMSWLELFRSARNGTLRIVGDGSNVHHPVDVADVVDAIMLCIKRPGSTGIFNIAGPAPISMRDMVSLMQKATGSEQSLPSTPAALVNVYSAVGQLASKVGVRLPRMESVLFLNGNRSFDISRAARDLGYHPRIQPAQAIERTATWYKSQGMLQDRSGSTSVRHAT
jgi:nucleoside-diphosphate-sugar epimerase